MFTVLPCVDIMMYINKNMIEKNVYCQIYHHTFLFFIHQKKKKMKDHGNFSWEISPFVFY